MHFKKSMLTSLILVILTGINIFSDHPGRTSELDMALQSAALKPQYVNDLEQLDQVPRYIVQAELLPEKMQILASVQLEYPNRTTESLSELPIILYPHMTGIYGSGSLEIEDINLAGNSAAYEISEDQLTVLVGLQPEFNINEKIQLTINYRLNIPMLPDVGNGILGKGRGVFYLAGWIPQVAVFQDGWKLPNQIQFGDGLFSETSLFEAHLTIPEAYTIASTGIAVLERTASGKSRWLIASGPARELTIAVSDKFKIDKLVKGGVIYNYYSLPSSYPVTTPSKVLELASQASGIFENTYGYYPYNELDIVDSAASIGGYEFPGVIFLEYGTRTRKPAGDTRWLTAHETAHQWWYGLVGNDQVNQPWLDEGLATYATLLFMEQSQGVWQSNSLLNYFIARAGGRNASRGAFWNPIPSYQGWSEYNRSVYYQAAVFLNELRENMGDEQFSRLMTDIQDGFRYQIITTSDFIEIATSLSPSTEELFREWGIQ